MKEKAKRNIRNILVTGGCGFIGTNFIRYILDRPDFKGRVVNMDKLTYAGNPENLRGVEQQHPSRYEFIRSDICDRETLKTVFKKYSIDTICHFAAESHVDRSIARPEAFIETNIFGTFSLLELARGRMEEIELFHHVSTDEVFGSLGGKGCFTEESPYRPNSPYAASKAGSDHLVRAYHKTYGLPVIISNCSNNYGPYQFPEKLIPLMILNAVERKPLPLYGDGRNVRDWLYVEDHCAALWKILQWGSTGETYNVGGQHEVENITLVEKLCDIMDEVLKRRKADSCRNLISFVNDRPGHDLRYAIDFSKVKKELQWSPAESFETGLRKTVQWYMDNQEWVNRVRTGEYRSWMKEQYGQEE
jgi:dTDP-glucose 4,6-dehydratase